MRKPYFKKSHNCWYVFDNTSGKPVRLDPDEKKAHLLWSRMVETSTAIGPGVSFYRLADEFCEKNDLA